MEVSAVGGSPRGLGAAVSGSFTRLPGAGMVPQTFRLARVGRSAWNAGGDPGRCCGCCLFCLFVHFVAFLFPRRLSFGFGFSLPPSLPATPSCLLLLAPSRHPLLGRTGSCHPLLPITPGQRGNGGPRWGCSPPPAACEGLGEESQCGKHTGLAPEPRALGVAPAPSSLETERGAAAGAGLTRRPLLSSPGWMSSHFAIIWSALDAERLKK